MSITFQHSKKITVDEFIDILKRSTLAERRPTQEHGRLQAMLDHANLLVTAWDKDLLVGIARSLTDHSFCCYLSDLAVDKKYQHRGIGKQLIERTRTLAGNQCALILLAAPAAIEYYPKIGMKKIENGFTFDREK